MIKKKHPTLLQGVKSGVDCAVAQNSSDPAEREGFEPPVQLPVHRISSAARSTTPASLQCRPRNLRFGTANIEINFLFQNKSHEKCKKIPEMHAERPFEAADGPFGASVRPKIGTLRRKRKQYCRKIPTFVSGKQAKTASAAVGCTASNCSIREYCCSAGGQSIGTRYEKGYDFRSVKKRSRRLRPPRHGPLIVERMNELKP